MNAYSLCQANGRDRKLINSKTKKIYLEADSTNVVVDRLRGNFCKLKIGIGGILVARRRKLSRDC